MPSGWTCCFSMSQRAATSKRLFRNLLEKRAGGLIVSSDALFANRSISNDHRAGGTPPATGDCTFGAISSLAGGLMSLRANDCRCLSAGRRLCRPHSQWRKTRRLANFSSRRNSNWSSTSRPPRHLASPVPIRVLVAR